jgi:hypothetical protein
MVGEEAAHEANLIDDKKPEGQTDQAGRKPQSLIETSEFCPIRVSKWKHDRPGDEHHARDGPDPEDEEINERPFGITNGGQDQERNRGGSSQPVNEPDKQRPQTLIETDPRKMSVEPIERGFFGRVGMGIRVM